MLFLSPNDLRALTGYKKPALQRRWLTENGYHFDVRADGSPALLTAQVEIRQLKGLRGASLARETPDFDALNG